MWQPNIIETTCILIWVGHQPHRNQHTCSIAPLNRDGNSLKQKRGITRIAGDGCDPTPKLRDKFDPIGANGAQCLDSNRYKSDSPRQVSIFADLGLRGRLDSSPTTCTVLFRCESAMNRTPWHPRQDSGPQTTGSWLTRQGVAHQSLSSL